MHDMRSGHRLIKGVDAGGVRWFLNGKPVHAGTELEILLALNPKYPELGGDPIDFEPLWVPVQIVFDFCADNQAIAVWPTCSAHMSSVVSENARFRWPIG